MPIWIFAAALGSILLTALLGWVLWRLNNASVHTAKANRGDASSDGGAFVLADGGGARRSDHDRSDSDGGSDGGGSDGGGGGGGGD